MCAILAIFRLLTIALIVIVGTTLLFLLYPLQAERAAKWLFTKLRKVLLGVLGVRVHGPTWEKVPAGLIMANHRSYLDVLFVPTESPITFVAKKEVKSWPLIGQAATALGTLWVKRENQESRRLAREAIVKAVLKGKRIVLFPEGTSWEGPKMLPLKPAMFFECAQHGLPIYIWSLHYTSGKAAYPIGVGFLKNLWTLLREPSLEVYTDIRPMPLVHTSGEVMIAEAQEWWAQSLSRLYQQHPVADELYWQDNRITSGEFPRL
mgnify:FL=1